ncbi:MAG: glycine--tRNA ligase subunit beta [Pseudomonadota bacterium]
MSSLLVEIGAEELPPGALESMAQGLQSRLGESLQEARLTYERIQRFATPRRLAVLVDGLAERQPDREIEKRGPPVKVAFDADGAPSKAAMKFAGGCGVRVDELQRIETPKGEWLVHRASEPGRTAGEVISEVLPAVVDGITVPRRMRWGSTEHAFSRPVRWLVVMLDDQVVPCEVLGCAAGRRTWGHRFHGPAEGVELATANGYEDALAEAYVVADINERREQIRQAIGVTAHEAGAEALVDPDLLDEVTALVELPVPVLATFDEQYLALPREVIIATLQEHQRYFPLTDSDGTLRSAFITIANLKSKAPQEVRRGNERVVSPRLADAAFFWQADGARTLASRREDLASVVYQRKLGTLAEKTQRITELATACAAALGEPTDAAERGAQLAKTDLLTDMVGEFPELQGVMGGHYARRDGESDAVADAIAQQYLPRFAGDTLPASGAGRALAIADRLDTLVGSFAIGARPTGNKDPFGLRRAALGVLRILIEGELNLDLRALLARAASLQPVRGEDGDAKVVTEVEDFLYDRLRSYYLGGDERGAGGSDTAVGARSVFEAVLAVRPPRPYDFDRRMAAIQSFAKLEASSALAAANKRISNILRKADATIDAPVDPTRLSEPAERALHEALVECRDQVQADLDSARYARAMTRLASLREPVDGFFDQVMVMSEDDAVRMNRLALLSELRALFSQIGDISLLQSAS